MVKNRQLVTHPIAGRQGLSLRLDKAPPMFPTSPTPALSITMLNPGEYTIINKKSETALDLSGDQTSVIGDKYHGGVNQRI